MDNPMIWAGIWLALAALFATGEMLVPGSFFLIPFAVGGLAASLASFLTAPVALSFPIFLVVSVATFVGLRPLANRLDADTPETIGVGANRLVGDLAIVQEEIPVGAGQTGEIKVGGERWRAETVDGQGAVVGSSVRIMEVRGTRVVVDVEVRELGSLG